MLLKRKRSGSELCSYAPSNIASNIASTTAAALMMDVPLRPLPDVPAHLNSRTFKRHRDTRPSDEEVHRKFYEWRAHHQQSQNSSCDPAERTLGLLYSAQQRQQQQQQQQPKPLSTTSSLLQPPQQQQLAPASNAQQSLHRFWNIGSAAPSSVGSSPGLDLRAAAAAPLAPSNCEDCGAGLAGGNNNNNNGGGGGGGADDVMDVDGLAGEDTACGACGKHVCFSCSISNLGEQKRCLQCAGRRVWIGGIGWTNASVSVC